MEVCTTADLQQRCRQRGYTLKAVRPCIVAEHQDGTITVDETHPAYPHAIKGWGDRVADGLAAVGITKQRFSRLLGRPCKCKERQRRLNELGQQAAAAVRKLTGQDATHATPEEQERRVDD